MTSGASARVRPGRARLSRSADFDRVIRRGRSHASRELVLYVFPREADGPRRLGLSVSRKVGGAVQRNRVKRLLREAFSVEGVQLPEGTDAVVVARREAWDLAERDGLAGIRAALGDLISRGGGGQRAGEGDHGAEEPSGDVSPGPADAEPRPGQADAERRPGPADAEPRHEDAA